MLYLELSMLCAYVVNLILIYKGIRLFWFVESLNQLRLTNLVGNIVLLLSQILSHLELDGLVVSVVSA